MQQSRPIHGSKLEVKTGPRSTGLLDFTAFTNGAHDGDGASDGDGDDAPNALPSSLA